ncbi:hypothetical protein LJR220_003341 [Bradyrhizobium sp. LjRoot220]|uniref:hypothetical protein n=1 Tax=Bradyrhizobium sp. LjRoot220 TaxID=3342284 RepID=UPI003ECFCEA3
MEQDIVSKRVTDLMSFKARAEKAIAFFEGVQAAGGLPTAPAGAATGMSDEVRTAIDDLNTKLDALLSFRVDVSGKLEGIPERLTALEGSKAEAESFSDRLGSMLTFFEENREGLEVLLSMDGVPDAPKAPEPAPEPAPADQSNTGTGPQTTDQLVAETAKT